VFFWSEPKTPWWKVVLGREPRSRRVVANTYDDNIETNVVVSWFKAPLDFPDSKSNKTLVGAIELNRKESLVAAQALCNSLGVEDMV
jgi:hypothetical protein